MTRLFNSFVDPGGVVAQYDWPINHLEMEPSGRRRTITATSPNGMIGVIRQQGPETPLALVLKGTILTLAQHQAMIDWWLLCRTQSIWFYEFSGEQYEVFIRDYSPTKVAAALNPSDPVNMPYNTIAYTLEMDVITILAGPWISTGP